MSALSIFTAPAELPITLAEARQHLKSSLTTEDALVLADIIAATAWGEEFTGRRFITQTWDLFYDAFPLWELEVPNPPLASVTSVKYVDGAGVEQTISSASYQVDTKSIPGRIAPAYGQSWPTPRAQMNAVSVRFVCGYGLAAAVPFPIKAALLLYVQYLEQRDGNETLVTAAERLLMPYRLVRM